MEWRRPQAEALLGCERYGEAETEARTAAESFRSAGDAIGAADAMRVVVKSLLGQGRRDEALAFAMKERDEAEKGLALAKLQVSVAEASLGIGSQTQAVAGVKEARRTFADKGAAAMEAAALRALAALEMDRGDADLPGLELGLRHAEEAKQRAVELNNRRLEAACLLLMVDAAGLHKSAEDALLVAEELLDVALELKDKHLEACTLSKLSAWNRKLGDRDRSISDAEEAWEIYRDLESPQEPQALRALVEGLLPVDPRRARRLCNETLARLREKGDKLAEIEVTRLLVEVLLRLGHSQEAASAAQDCILICKETGATAAQAALMVRLARARLQAGDVEKAKVMAENAWELLDDAKAARDEKADAMEVLCDAQIQSADLEDALARANEFRNHFAVAGDARGQAKAMLRCAQLQLEMTDYEAAFQSAQKACNIYHQERQKSEEADARLLCGKVLWRKGDHKAAVNWAERARTAYRELEQTEDEVACLYVVSENAARLAAREGASLENPEPAPRSARDALEKSLKSAEAGLKLLKVTTSAFPELHGQLLCARAQALTFKHLFSEALVSLDEAVLRFRELEEYELEANALLLACDNLFVLNRTKEAGEAAEEALMLYQHCQDLEGEQRARVMLKHPSLMATSRPSATPMAPMAPTVPGADVTPVWLQQADAAPEEAAAAGATKAVQRSAGPALDMSAVTPEAVKAKVRDIVAIVTDTDVEDIHAETPLMEAGLTSNTAIYLRDMMSKELGTNLPMTLVFDYPTITDMTDLVQSTVAAQAIKN
ncbi:HERC2 [Symbiodinium natans]|uniref:HERC2 protein n=1 Tax=Symbiodinium natans TaxID=878477 RepID=A0A812TKY8_9DINO|nr:HERC2 [Symbiodinium natans]